MMFSCSSADSRGVANGIFSWGIYFGYGLAYIYGKYLTRWVPRPLMRSTTFTRQYLGSADVLGYGWRASYVVGGAPGILIGLAILLVIRWQRENITCIRRKIFYENI